jgi:DNA invertase Pin-like site-specific DNA recombinase
MRDALIPAVAYARYSSSGQRDESIEGQCREIEIYAQHNGFKIIKTYIDKALTGRTDRRPGFQQMIADSEKHLFQAVICWKTDRFARNRYDAAVYKAKLRKNGVRLVYAREAVPDGPEGIILESVMEGFAEYYSANLGENVKRGNYDSALQHKTLGKRVFGYRKSENDTFEIDPEKADIVREIFSKYKSGLRMKDIVDEMNSRNIKTAIGGPFNESSVSKILRNEKYVGTYIWGDISDEDAIPPIIDKETFQAVQHRLAGSKKRRREADLDRPSFLLTGKCFCGHCGAAMVGDSAKGKTGIQYWYYTCQNKKKRACDKRREPKQELEDIVVHELVKFLHSDEDFLQTLSQKVADSLVDGTYQAELEDLKKRQADVQRKIQNALDLLLDNPSKALQARLSALEQEDEQLTAEIEEKALNAPPALTADHILFMLTKLSDGMESDPEYRRRIVDIFLNSVYVFDDGRIVLHLNFTQNSETVSLEFTKEFEQTGSMPAERVSIRKGIVSVFLVRSPVTYF